VLDVPSNGFPEGRVNGVPLVVLHSKNEGLSWSNRVEME